MVCGATRTIPDLDGPAVVRCSILPGHDGPCQAYYRDRLYEWTEEGAWIR